MKNGVMRFRKRPVVVEAVQYEDSKEGIEALRRFIPKHMISVLPGVLQIETLEGWMDVTPGDFIIKGLRGEYYPCKPDAFAETYEPLGEEAAA